MGTSDAKGLVVKIINRMTGGKYQTFDLESYGSTKALYADVDRCTSRWEKLFPNVQFLQVTAQKFQQ